MYGADQSDFMIFAHHVIKETLILALFLLVICKASHARIGSRWIDHRCEPVTTVKLQPTHEEGLTGPLFIQCSASKNDVADAKWYFRTALLIGQSRDTTFDHS
jgi:hypothetical protein